MTDASPTTLGCMSWIVSIGHVIDRWSLREVTAYQNGVVQSRTVTIDVSKWIDADHERFEQTKINVLLARDFWITSLQQLADRLILPGPERRVRPTFRRFETKPIDRAPEASGEIVIEIDSTGCFYKEFLRIAQSVPKIPSNSF